MLDKLVNTLIGVYQQDSQDYDKLLQVMQDFSSLLEKDFEPDVLEKELAEFAQIRDTIFKGLQERTILTRVLQQKICEEFGGVDFQAEELKPYLKPEQHEQLVYLTDSLQTTMTKVLELDALIIPKLTMELEGIKLELHRLQGAKKTKNVYENQGLQEAKFIDKTK